MKTMVLSVISSAAFAFSSVAVADSWVLANDKDGIRVETRVVKGQDLKDFRGSMTVPHDMKTVVSVLANVERMPQWFYMLREARMLSDITDDKQFAYMVIKGIWPVGDRDAVTEISASQDPKTHALTMLASAAPKHLPYKDGLVRIPRMKSSWQVTPLGPNQTKVQLNGNADPGGAIPVWLANMVVTTMPRETLVGLRMELNDAVKQGNVKLPAQGMYKQITFPTY